ncbi:MAG: UDP-N-acetylmuramoyl-L-alanyl-D-glutamate--2,6-diaminopimelate ligase [Pseudomonadota bacterium]
MSEVAVSGAGLTLSALNAAAGDAPLAHGCASGDPAIAALSVDSRQVRPGHVFVAVAGTARDGADFVGFALRQDAAAVVLAPDGVARAEAAVGRPLAQWGVPVLLAGTPRRWLALAAARIAGAQPAVMAAVTGTNGKTSVTHFLREIWEAAGHRAANLGTIGVEGRGFEASGSLTTPEPITLHAMLADLAARGCSHAAIEASSHGLAQHRADGVRLTAAALTHVTRDHLDYHADDAAYLAAKLRLFGAVLPPDGTAVMTREDRSYAPAAEIAAARGQRAITTGRHAAADLRIAEQHFAPDGQRVTLSWQGRDRPFRLNLIGAFQAENVTTAAALALATGIDAETTFAALPGLTTVRGRMELAGRRPGGGAVFVDYAHTPDALASALASIRPHATGRLAVVFGAGGDRDPGKRRLMGAACAAGADLAIVTDDNPRGEDPATIRAAVMQGCPEAQEIGDRAEAILAGVDLVTGPGDVLLIAGKGHEQGQEIAGVMHPFDDAEMARAAIAALDGPDWQEAG